MNFWKNSKRPLTPLLIFGKLYSNFFKMDMVAFVQGGIGQIVSVNINTIVGKKNIQGVSKNEVKIEQG